MAFLDPFFIRLTSRKVGQDRFGNTYWEARSRRDAYGRRLRRVIYAGADEADQAILHYRKALEVEPGNVRIRLALGEVLVQAKRPQEALAEVEVFACGPQPSRD